MFEWDRAKARANLEKHDVSFADTFGVFEDPNALTIEQAAHDEDRYVTIGLDAFGRLLVVVYTCPVTTSASSRRATQRGRRFASMKAEYDFRRGRRGAVLPASGNKVRITIRLDQDVIDWFKSRVESEGGGSYQAMINDALRKHIESREQSLEKLLRKVVREEIRRVS